MVNKVTVNPTCASRVYAALGFGDPLINHRGGALVSSDTGSTWSSLTSGYDMHQGPVADVQVESHHEPLSLPRWLRYGDLALRLRGRPLLPLSGGWRGDVADFRKAVGPSGKMSLASEHVGARS